MIRGRRGTSADLSFQVMGGAYSADAAATNLLAFDDRGLDIAPDGTFELRHVAEPGAKTLIVREVFNDWDVEERGTLTIERPDTADAPDRRSPARPSRSGTTSPPAASSAPSRPGSLPALLPVQGAGQHPDRAALDARRTGQPALLDRSLRARPRRGDDRLGPALRGLRLPGIQIGSDWYASTDYETHQTSLTKHRRSPTPTA